MKFESDIGNAWRNTKFLASRVHAPFLTSPDVYVIYLVIYRGSRNDAFSHVAAVLVNFPFKTYISLKAARSC